MKALTVYQPWASLIAVGAKRVETRKWPAPAALHGERLAIHAGLCRDYLYLVGAQRFRRGLRSRGDESLVLVDGELPLGSVVATAVLDRCSAITRETAEQLREQNPDEYAFGDYRAGRYAWVLRDVEALEIPARYRGAQRVFNIPDTLLAPTQGTLL